MFAVRRRLVPLVAAVALIAAVMASVSLAGSQKRPPVSPAGSVYVEQVPTAKGSAAANTSVPGTAQSGNSGDVTVLLVVCLGLVGAFVAIGIRRRRSRESRPGGPAPS